MRTRQLRHRHVRTLVAALVAACLTPWLGVALAVMTLSPQTAYAETGAGVGVVVGGGTIAPGLTTTPAFQTNIAFDGTIAGAFLTANTTGVSLLDIGVGLQNCSFRGASIIAETDALGHGTGMVMCTTIAGVGVTLPTGQTSAAATITTTCDDFQYDRIGPLVLTPGRQRLPRGNHCDVTINIPGHAPTTATIEIYGVFVFVPTSVQPVTSYQLVGVAVATPWHS